MASIKLAAFIVANEIIYIGKVSTICRECFPAHGIKESEADVLEKLSIENIVRFRSCSVQWVKFGMDCLN